MILLHHRLVAERDPAGILVKVDAETVALIIVHAGATVPHRDPASERDRRTFGEPQQADSHNRCPVILGRRSDTMRG